MEDIIERIKGLRYVYVPQASQLFEEAIAEIERLRQAIRRLADQDATLSVSGGKVTVTMDATLTDEEREAIRSACGSVKMVGTEKCFNTLVGLLERLA